MPTSSQYGTLQSLLGLLLFLKMWSVFFYFFKENETRYPVLSIMAANYLAIQGSSVPCERQFSSAGLVDTKQRNRLAASKFGSIEFLKSCYSQGCLPNSSKRLADDGDMEDSLPKKRQHLGR